LESIPTEAWSPVPRPVAASGALAGLGWVREIRRIGQLLLGIRSVVVTESLLGLSVVATASSDGGPFVAIDLESTDLDVAKALAATLRGAQSRSATLGDVATLVAPTDPTRLVAAFAADEEAVRNRVERYPSRDGSSTR
jgi:hypothetical protein